MEKINNKKIHIWGIKQNNLKNIEVEIPLGKMTVICGPSGSGKSSLAFETLYAEGQRRFIESMSNYTKQFLNKAPKPDIEGINNIPPAICIEQKNSVKNSRSTVGTTTELIEYLRLLYEKLAKSYCPTHKIPTEKHSVPEAVKKIISELSQKRGYILVEVSEKNKLLGGKKWISYLVQQGYLRIIEKLEAPFEIVDLSDPKNQKKALPKSDFYIVVDRMMFAREEEGRLSDSISAAYDIFQKLNPLLNHRKVKVLTTDGQYLNLSDENSCPLCDFVSPVIQAKLFSFNSPMGACPTCKGFGNTLMLDPLKVIPNPKLSLQQNALSPFGMPSAAQDRKQLISFCKKNKISIYAPWEELPETQKTTLWNGTEDFMGVVGLFEYLEQLKYKMHVRVFISRFRSPSICNECLGSRLRKEVNSIFFRGKNIVELSQMTIEKMHDFFNSVELSSFERDVSQEIFRQIKTRLDYLMRVGVQYLTLNRETKTLSGGEYQRLMLANQLGSGLSQTLYVLDEPTVGLHPRDNDRLISILKDLKNLGNTLVMVEHDYDVIRNSEYIIEMGPGSGYLGGKVVYSGSTSEFYQCKDSNTVPFLLSSKVMSPNVKLQNVESQNGASKSKVQRPVDVSVFKHKLEIIGARGNNLKNVSVTIPLNRFVVVTGVSGSGKSTLITRTLYPTVAKKLEVDFVKSEPVDKITGIEFIKNILLVDQSSIGKSARSSPISYIKAFDAIRTLMSQVPESKVRGYTPGTFSLNVDGGRCVSCKGTGYEEIDMQFMDNVIIPCDVCDGKKYRDEILEIKYKDKNIHEILSMTVSEAIDFFVAYPNIRKPLSLLKEVGLEYIQLGQPASGLSGGESQRLKIAKELSETHQKSTLYILDEPTTGLHFKEIELLLKVINKLVDSGGSVIVVEHNLDIIKCADYIIDLGPEAGEKGGDVVAFGSVDDITKNVASLTGKYLKKYRS